jgi:hypothetical protein
VSTTTDFLNTVVPWVDGAYINLHWRTPAKEPTRSGKDSYINGRACVSADDFEKQVAFWGNLPDVTDMWLCMSAQSTFEGKTSKSGLAYRNAIRSQQNVVGLKSIFLDVDVKEDAYPDSQSAVTALNKFIVDSKLPTPSAVVGSGSGGLHVYWSTNEILDHDEWKVLAFALRNCTAHFGLKTDPQVTIDSARLLRVPFTKNFKVTPPADVTMLHLGIPYPKGTLHTLLEPYKTAVPVTPAKLVSLKMDPAVAAIFGITQGANLELTAGLDMAQPIRLDEVASVCGFLGTAIADGGASYNNPLWIQTIFAATFMEDGRAAAHTMSKGHASYTPAETDREFDRVNADRVANNRGWPRCQTVANLGCTACATCPLLAKGQSPFNHKAPAPKPVVPGTASSVMNCLPVGYQWDQEGYIWTNIEDKSVRVMPYKLRGGWVQQYPEWSLNIELEITPNRTSKIDIPFDVAATKDMFTKHLFRKGVVFNEGVARNAREFIVSWISELQKSKDAVVTNNPFGWQTDDRGKIEGFAFGGQLFTPQGNRPATIADIEMASQYTPHGELDVWMENAKAITIQRRPDLDTLIAAAFAGPLVRFTGHNGMMVNTFSPESGKGKSTAMRVGQAVWGDPVRGMQGLTDTVNAVPGKLRQLKNIPLFWDELKTESQTKAFVTLAFQLTSGKEKARMNANAELRTVGTWSTLIASASNESLIDQMERETPGSTAGLYRCFEYSTRPVDKTHPGQVALRTMLGSSDILGAMSRLSGDLNYHYGQAGVIYAEFLGKNFARVQADVTVMSDKVGTDLPGPPDERFWKSCVATLLQGAIYANELGLTQIDIDALRKHLYQTVDVMRGHVSQSPVDLANKLSVSDILAQFMKKVRSRSMLVTNTMPAGPGRMPKGSIQPVRIDQLDRLDVIQAQYGVNCGRLRFSQAAFNLYLMERKITKSSIIPKLVAEFGMKHVNGVLGAGVDGLHTMGKENLWELNMFDPRLEDLIGDFTPEGNPEIREAAE